MEHRPAVEISKKKFAAVIFDLDGVITDTANLHAKAWKLMFDSFLAKAEARHGKPLAPFDIEADYLVYMDGKPRAEGIRSFLDARGIRLPEGDTGDAPGSESISGLGNLKNQLFLDLLRKEGVQAYGSTIELLQQLKSNGFKTAVISSSKNCAMILERANLTSLFDVKIDGLDAEQLRIKGKPAPDIFIEAADRLKVSPARAVVVEDAIAGVQAGRQGQFGLVIGVARQGGRDALLKEGADVVVADLAEVAVNKESGTLPSVLERLPDILRQAQGKRLVVFLDYDGTLTPIAATPDKAILAGEMRQVLIWLTAARLESSVAGI